MRKLQVKEAYGTLQQLICDQLKAADKEAAFETHNWQKETGYGRTAVMQKGNAIEKAAVNFSAVKGKTNKNMLKALGISDGEEYFATGISSIIHPVNPHVPIAHMNVRYFELNSGNSWFGGGIDITPHYVDIEEASWFHWELKAICDKHDARYYPEFKQWADEYFYLPHRDETRGVGGIFFDHQQANDQNDFEKLFGFTIHMAEAYARIYKFLLNRSRNRPYSEVEKKWQSLRRGRYVEFNLLYDRGTRFGLESNGRVESIFSSLPPTASWEYDFQPATDSREYETINLLKKGIDWVNSYKLKNM